MPPSVWVPGLIAGAALIAGALVTAIISARSSPYAALAERVARLEEQVRVLVAEQGIDRAHIIDVHWWDHIGRPGDIPFPPPWYRDRYPRRAEIEGSDD